MKRSPRPQGRCAPRRESLPPATHWENVADWYDKLVGDQGSEYHQEVVNPGVLRMLDLQSGQRVLDVACGQGILCRLMAEQGAEVLGVDASQTLIDQARTRVANASFAVGDARELKKVPGCLAGSFDAMTCVLAIQNITPLSPVWQGCRELLKARGRLVVVMMHPCFRVFKQSHWGWDEQQGMQYRRIDSYLSSQKAPIQMHPGSEPGVTTTSFHRPLQAYLNTLGSAGLWVDHIEEWVSHKISQAGPKKEALDKSRREFPLFMAIRARAC